MELEIRKHPSQGLPSERQPLGLSNHNDPRATTQAPPIGPPMERSAAFLGRGISPYGLDGLQMPFYCKMKTLALLSLRPKSSRIGPSELSMQFRDCRDELHLSAWLIGNPGMDLGESSEKQLVRQAMEGNEESFSTLRSVYNSTVFHCLRQYARNDDSLTDLVNKTWVEVQSRLQAYERSQMSFADFVENRTRFVCLKFQASSNERLSTRRLIDDLRAGPSPFETDEELEELVCVLGAKEGDPEAFNRLWARHQDQLYGFIRWQIRGEGADEIARDILSNLCLFLRQRITIYDPVRARFRTFAKFYADSLRKRYFKPNREIAVDWIQDADGETSPFVGAESAGLHKSVEDQLIDYEAARALLQVTFNLTSPPHQLVIFGFNKLLEWKPVEIVKSLSDQLLGDLEPRLEDDFISGVTYEQEFIRECFAKLRHNMGRKFKEVVRHPKALNAYKNILDQEIGTLKLSSFYTKNTNREDNVVKWAGNVWKTVRVRMLEWELGKKGTSAL